MCAAKRLSEAERKREIMDSAAKVIVAKGFENTTMEDIISGTTLSKGGVYHYYSSVIEIFKDIMIFGIDYRNEIIKEHLTEYKKNIDKKFMAKELVNKMVDDNPYMPLYVEFLLVKKRNPELNKLMDELQEQMKRSFTLMFGDDSYWLFNKNTFQFITDFINAVIVASDVLEARENFVKHRDLLERMLIYIFEQGEEKENEDI